MKDRVRAFVAIAIPDAVKKELLEAQERLKMQIGPTPKIRWTAPDQLHLTLRFFGDVPSDEIPDLEATLKKACADHPPFPIHIGGVGCLPSCANPRVIWAGIHGESENLLALQAAVQQATAHIGQPPEDRAYKPHLTIGRVKADRLAEVRQIGLTVRDFRMEPSAAWEVQEVELIRSDLTPKGSIYTVLYRAPLA